MGGPAASPDLLPLVRPILVLLGAFLILGTAMAVSRVVGRWLDARIRTAKVAKGERPSESPADSGEDGAGKADGPEGEAREREGVERKT